MKKCWLDALWIACWVQKNGLGIHKTFGPAQIIFTITVKNISCYFMESKIQNYEPHQYVIIVNFPVKFGRFSRGDLVSHPGNESLFSKLLLYTCYCVHGYNFFIICKHAYVAINWLWLILCRKVLRLLIQRVTCKMSLLRRGHRLLLALTRQPRIRCLRTAPVALKSSRTQNGFTGKQAVLHSMFRFMKFVTHPVTPNSPTPPFSIIFIRNRWGKRHRL